MRDQTTSTTESFGTSFVYKIWYNILKCLVVHALYNVCSACSATPSKFHTLWSETKDCQPKSEKPQSQLFVHGQQEKREWRVYSELVLISEDHQKVVYYGTGQVCKSTNRAHHFSITAWCSHINISYIEPHQNITWNVHTYFIITKCRMCICTMSCCLLRKIILCWNESVRILIMCSKCCTSILFVYYQMYYVLMWFGSHIEQVIWCLFKWYVQWLLNKLAELIGLLVIRWCRTLIDETCMTFHFWKVSLQMRVKLYHEKIKLFHG